MYLQVHASGLGLAAATTLAFCLSCGSDGTGTDNGSSDDSGTSGGTTSTGTGGSDTGGASSGGVGGTSTGGTGSGGTASGGTTGTGGTASGGSGGTGTASSGCGSPAGLTSGRASIDVGGTTREYILELPDDYDPDQPYRLIFGWHPWGGSAEQIANMGYFGLESVIDGQAILVAPEGQDYEDQGLGWGNEGGEDIDFFHAMVDRFSAELCIDPDRIFSTGFSFGAMFTFTLSCTETSMMRAIAPMAGNTFTSGGCEDSTRSVATMSFIGVDDSLLSGHRDAVQVFVDRNGCSTETTQATPSWCDGLSENYLPCSCVQYSDCTSGYPVIECEYAADHQFAPNAGATLWDFFSQF